ncbi:zinc-binding dehydrogenase [Alicyclobacillus sp. SO9]|uniref:L-erythro-3,5-diaminohexanoate dehydrogenase n=1 Tax=Alicyclobacillus sp. SO9 TaxID=2665646 RepID=UPI0018E83B9E|nr:zinc-binding dehydrogenase [Alicyclobacillus sp. SO9]QQE78875.1 zinc-binding dehydrogenase [Alicyclobacillus sp. SO9]
MRQGDKYGLHRVIEPAGVMPQAAWKIDNEMVCYDNEILIDVDVLNIDSASFTQIRREAQDDPKQVKDIMERIVGERGKHHNPVTGSGGMLIGRVQEMGEKIRNRTDVQVGDEIATLVSLSLTPLAIEEIRDIDMKNAQVHVKAKAILFESGIFAKLPSDLPRRVALAVFDVCGAPAQTARLVKESNSVVILGAGGKSGMTVLRQARLAAGNGKVIAVEYGEAACERLRGLGWADEVLNLDATKPADVLAAVENALGGGLADVVINCVNVEHTEMSSILCAKDRGTVYFFSMATSFTAAALGAEGVGKDVDMVIGNGYCLGHAELALDLLRESPELRQVFEQKFAAMA